MTHHISQQLHGYKTTKKSQEYSFRIRSHILHPNFLRVTDEVDAEVGNVAGEYNKLICSLRRYNSSISVCLMLIVDYCIYGTRLYRIEDLC